MSQNKILKDIAIKLGATVGEHVNDTNELLTAIAVALGATPTKKYNNVKDTLELIRDNVSAGGSGGENTLKKLLDSTKSTFYFFSEYTDDNLCDIIQYADTENVIDFYGMYNNCNKITSFPALDTSNGICFDFMYAGCSSATSFPPLDTSNGTSFANTFNDCHNTTTIDISKFTSSSTYNGKLCSSCHSLKAIIIRSFGSSYVIDSLAFYECYHLDGTIDPTYNPNGDKDCYIYVPRDMIETLSTATNWSAYATQLRALEDYTVDGTTTGELDDIKVNKNYYVVPIKDQIFIESGIKTLSITLNEFTNVPTVNITSDNEEVATISNVNATTSEITFDVNVLGVEGNANINVSVNGYANNEFTFNVVYANYTEPTYSVEAVNGATYGFELNSNGYYESKNKGISNSYAICKILIDNPNVDNIAKMTLTCINYADNKYDYGILSNIDATLTLSSKHTDASNTYKLFKYSNSSSEQTVVYNLPNGEHYIYAKFIKDSAGNYYNDSLQFKVSFGL